MNFHVFIRTIGERTEKLSYESVKKHIPEENIHIIKNYTPSYLAYKEMFKQAKQFNCDWYLGLDADVILRDNWWGIVKPHLLDPENSEMYRLVFIVKDFIAEKYLDRGNHFYNGKYVDDCLKYINLNIKIANNMLYRLFYSSFYVLRPESSIPRHMYKKKKIANKAFSDVIGWHGYEQYYSEIFRQYVVRKNRDANFKNNHNLDFLSISEQDFLCKNKQIEKYVANLGWNNANLFIMNNISSDIQKEIHLFLSKYAINEKLPLLMSLDEYYKKHAKELKDSLNELKNIT